MNLSDNLILVESMAGSTIRNINNSSRKKTDANKCLYSVLPVKNVFNVINRKNTNTVAQVEGSF